jgi:quercetin dioxygenase-like cupin family protein
MPPSRHGSLFAALAAVSVVAGAAAADAPSDARPAPVVVATADTAEQAYDAGVLRILVPAAATGGRYAVLELNEAPGYRTPPHVHPGMDESFYALEGTLELEVGGTTHTLAAGSYVHIPRGTPHAQGSADDLPVKLLTTFTPGGFEAFFLDRVELARTVRRGDEEFLPRMMDVVHRHGAWLQPAQ